MATRGGNFDPLDTPNCPVCLRPMEAVEQGGVVLWDCGYCDLDA